MSRLDSDIQFHRPSTADVFEDMERDDIHVGWVQHIPNNGDALASSLFSDTEAYVQSDGGKKEYPMSDIWPQVSIEANRGHANPLNNWRPYLSAGKQEKNTLMTE